MHQHLNYTSFYVRDHVLTGIMSAEHAFLAFLFAQAAINDPALFSFDPQEVPDHKGQRSSREAGHRVQWRQN